jgi:hypothetical protein
MLHRLLFEQYGKPLWQHFGSRSSDPRATGRKVPYDARDQWARVAKVNPAGEATWLSRFLPGMLLTP